MMLAFLSFIVLLLLLINTYPVWAMRDVVYTDKEQSMSATAAVVSSALSGLDVLTAENVPSVIALLNVAENHHILVTDERKTVIYDSWGENLGTNLSATFSDIGRVFSGKLIFRSTYDKERFTSQVCAPVMVNGNIIGSVYLVERDRSQAELISDIRNRLTILSLAIGFVAIAISLLMSRALTTRIRQLAGAVKVVQAGDFTHQIPPAGDDELTELTHEFNAMTDILRQNEEMRRQFVSDASHELKTPLASIRLLSDSILQSENIDRETTLEFVEDIGACAQRLQHMTEKLLDLSRMDSGVLLRRELVDLSQVLGQCLPVLWPLARQREVTLDVSEIQPVVVEAAEEDLYQIVLNLVENAVKYNVPGGRVTVHLFAREGQGILRVEDTGIGIPPEDVPNIFSRFYRVDKARSREAGGSGLGLSIVRDAVILHGGQIQVDPNEPQGTVFTVTFPIATERG